MKPSAYISDGGILFKESPPDSMIKLTPLYAIRELTEDEIREVADSVCHAWKKNGVGEIYMTDFARAILKKASEK
jgi:hypothetical protein